MITVQKARRTIARYAKPIGVVTNSLDRARGSTLAEDIVSHIDVPSADNSAMDGYALRSADTRLARPGRPVFLRLGPPLRAGDKGGRRLRIGEACAIMTGAPLPPGADTVLMREEATVVHQQLCLRRTVATGNHVRRRGEDVRQGETLLRKGTVLNAGAIAALAALGRDRCRVFAKPLVALITTGDELAAAGSRRKPGQIFDSNFSMISAALPDMGISLTTYARVPDQPSRMRQVVRRALQVSDVLLLVGGVSVGDFDFGKSVLRRCGVRQVFWRVDQKPGKPLFFGHRGRTLVFGLPGNPGSAFVCFYAYVFEALRRLMGHPSPSMDRRRVVLASTVRPAQRKMLWVRGRLSPDGLQVIPLAAQQSHRIATLHQTEALIQVPRAPRSGRAGSWVWAEFLPDRRSA